MVNLSIIIVTWNAKAFAWECLDSLRSYGRDPKVEIIVVDNASTDGTPELIQQDFKHVKLLTNTSNLGFAKANNIGMQISRGRYLCLVNSDVNVPPECLGKMLQFMEGNSQVGVLGPQMIAPNGKVARSYMRFPNVWRSLCNSLGLHSLFPGWSLFGGILMSDFKNDRTAEVDVLNGWFLMIRRRALEQVGMLDERFFMYGEDIDWSYRFHKAGWKRVYYAEACALHYGAASSAAAPTRFYIEMQRANLKLWRKHHGWLSVVFYQVTVGIHQVTRIIGYSVLFAFLKSSRTQSVMKVRRSLACLHDCWKKKGGYPFNEPNHFRS